MDLGVLARLSTVLQGSPVGLPLALLSRCSPQVLQEEYQRLLEELVAAGLLSRAQRVAQLAGIPADALLINQVSGISVCGSACRWDACLWVCLSVGL